mmetsp:Transcript_15540/g.41808  ORF Transcript_15540/g.41808 Transcript_15540/m.41808 type:complete len:174 (+) Transcript_15540:104-625(+)
MGSQTPNSPQPLLASTSRPIRADLHCPLPTCKRQFPRPSQLADHLLTHTGERPYHCAALGCEKVYEWRSSLAAHARVHGRKGHSLPRNFYAGNDWSGGRTHPRSSNEAPVEEADLLWAERFVRDSAGLVGEVDKADFGGFVEATEGSEAEFLDTDGKGDELVETMARQVLKSA